MTTQGPLGNKQVRVEDWITITPAGATGTAAVNTVTVNASAGAVPAGAYFALRSPDALRQEAEAKQILSYHLWYSKESAVDPLPTESNQTGIQVVIASGQATDVVASNTVSAINAYFTGTVPAVSFSAERSGNDVVITNQTVGPARVVDGIGSRNSVAASTGFSFASTTPGVNVSSVSFTIASTIEGSSATGASILTLIPQITDNVIVSTYEVSDNPESLCILCPDGTEFDQGGVGQHLLLTAGSEGFYLWYNSGSVATIHRIAGITADTDGSLGGLGLVLDSSSGLFNFWFNVSALSEVTSIRTIADADGSLAGTFFKIDDIGASSEHYVWFNVSALAEVTSIRTVADVDGDLAGTFFKIDDLSASSEHYVWMSVSAIVETTRIQMPADATGWPASAADAAFFQVRTANDAAAGSAFYVWFSVAGLATDPVAGSGVGIEITTIASADVAAVIATQTASVINAFAFGGSTSFTAVASADSITLTQVEVGPVSPFASSGAAASDVTASVIVSTLSSGLATSVDPAPVVTGVGIQVDILRDDMANTVATQVGSAIGLATEQNFGTPTVSATEVLVTGSIVGPTPNASDNNTGFSISTVTQGLASSVDPAPSVTGIGIRVDIDPNDTAATIAAQLGSVLQAVSEFADDFTTSVSGIDVVVTVGTVGNTPDASDNNTGFTIVTLTQGTASSVDPAQGGSSVPVAIDSNDSAATVASLLSLTMGLANESGSFTTSVSGLSICAINVNEGTSETGLTNTTGFSISALLAGRNPNSDPVAASTGLEVSASRLSTSAEVCTNTATVINANPTFTASVVGDLVEVNTAEAGIDLTASAVTASGVGLENVAADFSVTFSNRHPNPDFDKETS